MKIFKGVLIREYEFTQTKGELSVFDKDNEVFNCKTLELPWLENAPQISCITERLTPYKVVIRYSKKYGRHLHIKNVEGRSLILIHWGNYAGSVNPRTKTSDIRGCVLVGSGFADIDKDGIADIINSKNTFDKLMSLFTSDEDVMLLEIKSGN